MAVDATVRSTLSTQLGNMETAEKDALDAWVDSIIAQNQVNGEVQNELEDLIALIAAA